MRSTGRLALIFAALASTALLLPAPGARAAGEVARLYAPKPPPGSAFVRVVDLSGSPGSFTFGDGPAAKAADGEAATLFRIVKGGVPLTLSRDGKPVAGALVPAADGFSTVVIPPGGAPAQIISDSTEGRNDLKAQLRFYNFVPGCAGAVAVVDGPTVFEDVATFGTRQRVINPIEASLTGRCGGAASQALKLPPLKAGDNFSLFLVQGPSGVTLLGQRDETEPYRGTAN
ncbi:alginate O-acetyltransferase AlgF [Xanthobacter pseudotagetidis]|uniref:alginate O-acetyltransferase AlgF n=1 Tax=Xanthobacter pseudotagetidis TaxID=3119911 RepID=UPI00372B7C02